jgi:hypothetical protein
LCDDVLCIDSIKLIWVILIRSRSSIIDKYPVMYKEEPRKILLEIGSRCISSGKWYSSNYRELLSQLSRYSLAFKPKVILSSPISGLSDTTPVSITIMGIRKIFFI